MNEVKPVGSNSHLDSLDDSSLCWLEQLSLDNVSPEVRDQWEGLLEPGSRAHTAPTASAQGQTGGHLPQSEAVKALIAAYHRYGHLAARLDPLALSQPELVPELEAATYGLDDCDPATSVATTGMALPGPMPFGDLVEILKHTYCDTLAVEVHRGESSIPGKWLLERLEQRICPDTKQPADPSREEKLLLLSRLTAAEELERYLGRRYPGAKRFGLEGAESLIPLLDAMVVEAARRGAQEICLGMAHRGRLNVLVNLFGKPTEELFAEFDGTFVPATETGDVKYHQGFSSNVDLPTGQHVHLSLSFNPSHLEAVGPVVEGSVRARQDRRQVHSGGDSDDAHKEVVPILLHGDAAFSGQGVVMETLQMSATPAYGTGGTVHVVINNQIGYTTSNPQDARSTHYCTDVSRLIAAPVLHVNTDDPEAVVFAATVAMEYRYLFSTDIVLDLVCFRRMGHNEADEPAATQPLMYRAIREHPGTRQRYADKLQSQGHCGQAEAEAMIDNYRQALEAGAVVTACEVTRTKPNELFDWTPHLSADEKQVVPTALSPELVEELTPILCDVPKDFALLRQVEKLLATRRDMLAGDKPLDWGCAEMLVYGSLLHERHPIRFTGQDCRRGTFTHRHLVLFDQKTGREYSPLQQIASEHEINLSCYDSLLSEEAVLAFEYGYSATWPSGLVVWEAQFGDFANGAQVIIDQFIVSGEQKWKRLSGLVLLLPHGHEGQGPEHSSARLERFLQLCSRHNIQVCIPSTPAQLFHLLRRQVIRPLRKPLVVMTPKSLLRLQASTSPLTEFTEGQFSAVLDDTVVDPKKVRRIVLCSGRIYYPLRQRRDKEGISDTAIVRLEQLYPFPYEDLDRMLRRYASADQMIWCQEDPSNQGAWHQMMHRLYRVTGAAKPDIWMHAVSRESAAAPAVGWPEVHKRQEEMILRQALGLDG